MSTDFSINKVELEKVDSQLIINNIYQQYIAINPGNNIKIIYERISREYTFNVLFEFTYINKKTKSKITSNKIMYSYNNAEAINLFSNYNMKYLEKYDFYKKQYLEKLIEYIENLIICYKLLGLTITYKLSNDGIIINSSCDKIKMHNIINLSFEFYDMIMPYELESFKKNIEININEFYERYNK